MVYSVSTVFYFYVANGFLSNMLFCFFKKLSISSCHIFFSTEDWIWWLTSPEKVFFLAEKEMEKGRSLVLWTDYLSSGLRSINCFFKPTPIVYLSWTVTVFLMLLLHVSSLLTHLITPNQWTGKHLHIYWSFRSPKLLY